MYIHEAMSDLTNKSTCRMNTKNTSLYHLNKHISFSMSFSSWSGHEKTQYSLKLDTMESTVLTTLSL